MNDIVQIASEGKKLFLNEPDDDRYSYNITFGEIKTLMKIAESGTTDDMLDAIITAFCYGIGIGEQITTAKMTNREL